MYGAHMYTLMHAHGCMYAHGCTHVHPPTHIHTHTHTKCSQVVKWTEQLVVDNSLVSLSKMAYRRDSETATRVLSCRSHQLLLGSPAQKTTLSKSIIPHTINRLHTLFCSMLLRVSQPKHLAYRFTLSVA